MEPSSSTVITVSTTVNATMEKAWDFFNEPGHITHWYHASKDWHAPAASSDFRDGGKGTIRMEAKDGSAGFDFVWTYDSIIPHRLITYTIADGRKVEISFQLSDEGIIVTEKFEAEKTNPTDLQKAGWQAILDSFKKYTESR
jgi:uncharacterized protein YndB with AHSA1/START domain